MKVPETPLELWTEAVLVDAERAMREGRHVILVHCFYCRAPYVVNVLSESISGRCGCGSGIGGFSDPSAEPTGSFRYIDQSPP